MLNIMRKYAGTWLIKIILGAIVVVFVFWGVGSFRAQKKNIVALVNDEPIMIDEFRETYNNILEQLRQRFGSNLNDDMIKMLQIKEQALDQLIDQRLLLLEARKLNFRVTDGEIADVIMNMKAFQKAEVFDGDVYRSVLNRYRLSPEKFETLQKEWLLIEKLKSFITGSLKVSENEAMQRFNWNNASVNIDYALFEPDNYKDINPTREEIKTFFDKHKESYKTKTEIKARYIHFDPDAFKSKVIITDDELSDYYQANTKEFVKPKTVEARHILIKVEQNADIESVEKAKKKTLDVLKLAKEGKDFAKLAKQYSEGPGKESGGYLGAFAKKAMVKPFADKAFSMEPGQLSEPVRTRFGWHIIKVEKINKKTTISLDEAKNKIRKNLTREKAVGLAYDEAEVVFSSSFEGEDMVKTAKDRGLETLTTDFFDKKGPKGIKDRAKFASAAFNLSLMEISAIQDLKDGYYIIQMVDKLNEKIPELQSVEKKITIDLIKEKQDGKAHNDANSFLSEVKNGASMTAESNKYKIQLNTTGFFKRDDPIPGIKFEKNIINAAFKLSNSKKFPEDVIKGKKGYYIIKFKDRKEPASEGFNKEKTKIKDKLLQEKKRKTFEAWITQVRNKSIISIEKSFLD